MGWAQLLGGTRTLTINEEDTQIATPPSGAEDIVERIGALYPSPGTDEDVARVGIERIEHADGTRAWIVEIPGTQEFLSPGGPNPFDFVADVQMMAKMTSDVMVAVTAAMEQAGIAAGEAVMLGGHSLGGIAAMALASNESFSSRYSVAAVVTAGSPVARFAPIGGPSVLSLENSTDIVWALDGAANPDRATWTTVHQDLRASELAADRAAATSLVGSHEPATYARTAALFDASAASSARAWREQNAAFFADGASTSTRTTYDITRSADTA
jgi:pimeloyl-ACP methyl ester carboxylesterase